MTKRKQQSRLTSMTAKPDSENSESLMPRKLNYGGFGKHDKTTTEKRQNFKAKQRSFSLDPATIDKRDIKKQIVRGKTEKKMNQQSQKEVKHLPRHSQAILASDHKLDHSIVGQFKSSKQTSKDG
mmetsp:Transcript_5076/g.7678  ORF Transcript_5076/g.7678 Transcript_5076/m.7678 type:complete len:125 (+) Transcript_5076:2835-3209(+)